jgi:hypothetical protein
MARLPTRKNQSRERGKDQDADAGCMNPNFANGAKAASQRPLKALPSRTEREKGGSRSCVG